ncbi:MAG: phenylalanine--tRNA ligase subunit beta [Candidatus Paceibacterota bacterium]|jgi:phenylalanyl-tRNA synthetase beta chain
MKVSYAWLQTYIKEKLPEPSDLEGLFSAHAFEVEGTETVGNDTVFDIKVLPDRSHYALSHRGIAREAAALARLTLTPEEGAEVIVNSAVYLPGVKIETDLCRRYIARRIDNVKVGESPAWLKEHLEAIGARSINSIVDATNFVMFALGQPLHAFDANKVQGAIVARVARADEKITILDGREVALLESDVVIADDDGPLAIAGVKGGKRAEVTASTVSIILESANFDPTSVRKTSTRANLRNDSSKRFENEITPELAGEAMQRVTALILGLCAGSGAGAAADVYPHPAQRRTIIVDAPYVNAVTGLSLSAADMSDILTRLQCEVKVAGDSLSIIPPFDRLDLVIPEDIADEIVRVYGYDKLGSKETPIITPVAIDAAFFWAEKAKNILVPLGFSEVMLYSLVPKGAFEIAYPLASDKSALRERISLKLSDSLTFNARNAELLGLETVRIFEIGKVFPKEGERMSLCIGVSQVKKRKGVTSESVLKEAVATFEASFGVKLDGKIEVGPFGALIEVNFDAAVSKLGSTGSIKRLGFTALSHDIRYRPFSAYPFIVRDIALFVPSAVEELEASETIRTVLASAAGTLLVKGPDCFDRFEKDGRKSLGFRMIFQSFEKTLSDEEVGAYMSALYAAISAKGWEVR